VAAASGWLLAVDAYLFYVDYVGEPVKTEFLLYYLGGWICRFKGCGHLYDLNLQRPLLLALRGGMPTDYWVNFVNPPPLAWLMVPLTLLPVLVAQWIWLGFMSGSFIAAIAAVNPWRGVAGVAVLLLALGLFPVDFAARLEQVDVALAGGLGLAWWLLQSRRDWAAGALLALLLAVKPFLFSLVVPALLLLGRYRALAATLAAGAVLLGLSAFELGPSGIQQYLATSALSTGRPTSWTMTPRYVFGPGFGGSVAEAVAALAVVAAIFVRRSEGIDTALPAAVLGCFLASPYLHDYDVPVLLVAALIWLRQHRSPIHLGWFLFGAAAVEVSVLTPLPFLLFEVGWLALLLAPMRGRSVTGVAPAQGPRERAV
jgi:Glycosyltransferase family 87